MLVAFSKHNPDIGYCQGMSYLAALILIGVNVKEKYAEEFAFFILKELLETVEFKNSKFQLMSLYDPSLKGLF